MAIITGDFVTRLSGGAANAVGNLALGGVKSNVAMSASVDALFDATSAAEALAGDVEYRCVYLHNANAVDTMIATRVWVAAQTPLASTSVDIGLGSSAVNGTEQTVLDETTAPLSVTFSQPATYAAGLVIGDIPLGQHKALWIRRTVTAASASSANDTWQLGYQCDTV